MRRPRFIAPWHRRSLARRERDGEVGGFDSGEVEGLQGEEAEVAAALLAMEGKPAIYHCVSRVVNRDFVLGRPEKEHFVRLMRSYERFCQVRVLTFCVMSNHFHILLEVPAAPEDGGASWSDERLLEHLGGLYTEVQMGKIRWELEHYRSQGNDPAAEAMRGKYFARMWDLSAFMKVLKQRFTQWFNRRHERRGHLWEERFKSALVEDGHAARTVAAYIDLNPVRAGIVDDPKDYRWCGYGEAVAGVAVAREGLRLVLFEKRSAQTAEIRAAREVASWRQVIRVYRMLLFGDGEESERDGVMNRQGISKQRVARVLESGGILSETEMIHCKVRYLVDGMVIGSTGFVDHVFGWSREWFGPRRRSGARKMKQVRSALRTIRALQVCPMSA